MRVVKLQEKKKRGCEYCTEKAVTRDGNKYRTGCPHDVCPFTILDKYETYEEYMESEDCRILVNEFFATVSGVYDSTRFKNAPLKLS